MMPLRYSLFFKRLIPRRFPSLGSRFFVARKASKSGFRLLLRHYTMAQGVHASPLPKSGDEPFMPI